MFGNRWTLRIFCFGIVFFLWVGIVEAVPLDDRLTLMFTAKAQTRNSIRLNDSEGFTSPPDIGTGDLVQQRNLLYLELNHDLTDLTDKLDLLYPLKALDVQAKYRLVGRFMYDGVYDYGPEPFQRVRDKDKENIDSFKQSYDLWECYVDLSRGPLFLRLGKQNLSWGETDSFRLLDYINPLDNTFGGPFEDLDDRRIPLWMLRGTYNVGNLGLVKTVTLESFWVPGFWDVRVAPWAPGGTPYSAPLAPDLLRFLRFEYPEKNMDSSRWGFRVMGMLGSNLNVALGHYRSYLDMPAMRALAKGVPVPPSLQSILSSLSGTDVQTIFANPADMAFEASFLPVHISGASMNYYESFTDTVFRGEMGWFWDEPVFIPQINAPILYDPVVPLPPEVLALAGDLFGVDIQSMGLSGLPVNPRNGEIPKKDILRYMIGIDKQTWIRPFNRFNTFFLSFQYFGQWVPDYDNRMRQPLELYPSAVDFAGLRETEHVFTALASTFYWNGRLMPQIALAYDVRGVWLIQPQVSFIHEPFRFQVQYSAIEGNFTNFGAFRDRDQVTLILTYLLN